MQPPELSAHIISRGKALFTAISDDKPSLFTTSTWTGKVMDWCMRNEEFKARMFRFVDVFPSLATPQQISDHIRQYFGDVHDLPPVLAGGLRMAGSPGALGGSLLAKLVSANIHEMARQFIIAETTAELVERLHTLYRDGYSAVVDVLGEATLSDDEAEAYVATYLELLDALANTQQGQSTLPDREAAPAINVAVKPTALFCLANPMDFEGSVEGILRRLHRICSKVTEVGGFLCIDMESYRFKEITLEVYRRLRREFRDYPHIGIVLQAYLTDTDRDLDDLLAWACENSLSISIRLVKGAYWDYETLSAQQMGWKLPVRTGKSDTDAAFERLARTILENHRICHFACGSHNIRTIAAVLETARFLQVPPSRYEFQMLYGMAEPVRRSILRETGRVRLYCPYGDMVPGMGYLVRRLLENTANESFLRLSFSDGVQVERLLEDPAALLARAVTPTPDRPEQPDSTGLPPFRNEASIDFTRTEQRAAFPAAIAGVRAQSRRTYPLFISGREIHTAITIPSINPARPFEVLGNVCQADLTELNRAVASALAVFPSWRDTPPETRADYLLKAAGVARRRIFELSAWQVLEIGKQWDQAHADVAEAIDFLEYYAREMIRLGTPQRLGNIAGEINLCRYEPRGVAAVIAPWNFPLAISTGMASAAIVAGNPVVFKPSGLTGIIGYQLAEIFRETGLPDGVFNYLPGRGSTIGDALVDHPDISVIAFTGSMKIGMRIMERAARVHPGQGQIKKVVCEMGGKNAIIIDDDADLDEAVPQVLTSAFGFQGQKCSACSRVIVLAEIYDRFVKRLVSAARAWRVGEAENPAFSMGAVADDAALRKILEYVAIGEREGNLLYRSPVPEEEGFWAPLTVIGGIRPEHRLAREEIFGPVLAVMRARNFDEALIWANSSSYALTGGIFTRSPEHITRAQREFRVGNMYINRAITGAMVGRQPFGGAGMSGGGTKAGGPDYLPHFMIPRVVTENTLRRGFTPVEKGSGHT
jgi:RHH-type proline utilization regulon transcriptional repressor/proline dehydrogenase/delta 1-pyrroline-5-carboxylate dehydrogenase